MSEVYIRSQNKEKLYRLGGNYACVEYGEYEDIKKKRGGAEADKKRHVICISDGCLEEIGEYTIEIERYFTSRYKKKGISRGDKVKPTKEEQEKVNTRQAERKLRILINANYGYGDYHLVLDYIRRKGEPDRTPEQMRQDIDVFLRECRKEYRKAGLEFKYIHVMEIGKKGARHHHLVVNKIDTEILQRCWYKAYEGHNRVKVFPLDDSGNYAELASYLIKYTGTHKKGTDGALQGKRWNCSKNLVRPEPEYHIISDREYFKKEPKAIKGYYVDKNSVSMGVHSPEYYGYGYLRYTLVKITDRGG